MSVYRRLKLVDRCECDLDVIMFLRQVSIVPHVFQYVLHQLVYVLRSCMVYVAMRLSAI